MLRVNSKKVLDGDTFIDLSCNENSPGYIAEAIDKGAVCIITDKGDYPVKTILTNDTRKYLSSYLRELYLEKMKKIKVIGIVGTSGKTSTGDILYNMFNSLGFKTSFISSNGFCMDYKVEETISTTPDIYSLYEYINRSIDESCENVIVEISSSASNMGYVDGIDFDVLIFTNIILKGMDKSYLESKTRFFENLKKGSVAVINKSDSHYKSFVFENNRNVFYGSSGCDFKISDVVLSYDCSSFKINDDSFHISFVGKNLVYDFLAAYSTCISMGYEYAVGDLSCPSGRYQSVKYKNSLIVVDYAYTPSMIKNVVNNTKEFCNGKIIIVIGAGGERREDLRHLIGKVSTEISDYVIFTSDNSRGEEPSRIIDDIVQGVKLDNYEVILSRKDAIKKGISLLSDGDILLILGRGSETVIDAHGVKVSFNDFDEVCRIIR